LRVYAKARYCEHGRKQWRGFSAIFVGEREVVASYRRPWLSDFDGDILWALLIVLNEKIIKN